MEGMESIIKLKRTPIDFPIGENVRCYLSNAVIVSGSNNKGNWSGVKLTHATKVPNLSDNAKTKYRLSYFRDTYFLPSFEDFPNMSDMDSSNINRVEEFQWFVSLFLKTVYNESLPFLYKDFSDYSEYLVKLTRYLSSLPRNEYYVKVRLVLVGRQLVPHRGETPYISPTPNLSYKQNEDKYHTYIINIKLEKDKANESKK